MVGELHVKDNWLLAYSVLFDLLSWKVRTSKGKGPFEFLCGALGHGLRAWRDSQAGHDREVEKAHE